MLRRLAMDAMRARSLTINLDLHIINDVGLITSILLINDSEIPDPLEILIALQIDDAILEVEQEERGIAVSEQDHEVVSSARDVQAVNIEGIVRARRDGDS